MYNDVITLIAVTNTPDNKGNTTETTTEKDVFAQVRSVGMRETYEAMSVGLKPELTFVLADYYDYSGQEFIEYESVRYKVLRTYRKTTNEIEIVVTSNGDS